MIRGFAVLLCLLLVAVSTTTEKGLETVPIDGNAGSEGVKDASTINQSNGQDKAVQEEKVEKFDEEILEIGNDAKPVTVQENITTTQFTTTTTVAPKTGVEASIDGVETLEPGDEGEQLRQPSEKELAELSDKVMERKDGAPKNVQGSEEPFKPVEEEGLRGSEEPTTDEPTKPAEGEEFKGTEEPLKPAEEEVFRGSEEPTTDEPLKATEEEGLRGSEEPTTEDHPVEEEEEAEKEPKKDPVADGSVSLEDKDLVAKRKAAEWEDRWNLIQFLIMLTPNEEEEVSWWQIISESVKCSLRGCQTYSHWKIYPVYLPRITRHRRHADGQFEVEQAAKKPCPCQNLEAYFEKLYESMGKEQKKNTTQQ
ncbi:unnamed protein product [Caenorhabditis sp. 36 PRJEB53466]|nr:unnamed protein product [Caenorhabditis sp. 36 PRJEB53466]